MPFGIGHPHLHIKCSLHVCGRIQGSQIFKRNSIISIHSKVMAFLVISLSPWSPHCPRGPHIIPVVPTLFPCHPCHPHIIPIAPRRSPCGPNGCGLCGLHPMLSLLSPWFPCCPRLPHIIPVIPTSSPHHLEGSHTISNPQIPTPPTPIPLRGGELRISKNAVRFELNEIF